MTFIPVLGGFASVVVALIVGFDISDWQFWVIGMFAFATYTMGGWETATAMAPDASR